MVADGVGGRLARYGTTSIYPCLAPLPDKREENPDTLTPLKP